jgi:hypothetical protein
MAKARCQCGNETFELDILKVYGSKSPVHLVICTKCGLPVGAVHKLDIEEKFTAQNKFLAQLGKKLDDYIAKHP